MNAHRIEYKGLNARNILSCFLLASLLTTCASSFPMLTPPPTFLPDSQTGAEDHHTGHSSSSGTDGNPKRVADHQ